MIANFVVIASFANLDHTFRYFTKDVFGLSELGTGVLLALVGVLGVVTQGAMLRPLANQLEDAALVRLGSSRSVCGGF